MISIRPPAPAPKPGKRRVVERVRQWAQTPTGCSTCNAVRRAAGKVVDKVVPPKR